MLRHGLIDKQSALPRHAQIESYFRDLIATGRLAPGERIPPEIDIANTLGVSRMTVNKALLALTRAGLFVRERGVGTFVASAPAARGGRLIVSVPMDLSVESDQHDYYYAPLYRAMHAEADISHHQTTLAYLPHGDFAQYQRKKPAEGWLVIAPDERHLAGLTALAVAGTPAVIVGACWPEIGTFSTIDSDNVAGAREIVRYLAGLGHERIALLYAGPEASNTQDRISGYRQALKEAGISHRPEWEIRAESAERLGEASAQLSSLLSSPDESRPTAIFAAGYYIALETLAIAEQMGLSVPRDLSVAAYDDPFAAQLVRPPLTTVRQPLAEMGRAAVAQLDRELRRANVGPVCIRLAPTLQIRGSTAPPAAGTSTMREQSVISNTLSGSNLRSSGTSAGTPREESSNAN